MANLLKLADWRPTPSVYVVFVHGLGGHPYDTWRQGRGDVAADPTFWPLWLAKDIPCAAVLTLGYDAAPSGWFGQTMPFEDRTRNLAELFALEDFAPEVPIVLVTHSLGGLLTKSMLLLFEEEASARPEFARCLAQIRGVVFLATPHSGARQATLLDRLRALAWPSPLTTALVSDAPALRRINTSYRRLAAERGASLRHRVFFETRATALGMIVKEGAADPGLNDPAPVGIDANHVEIAKPRDRQALNYRIVMDFIRDLAVTGAEGALVGPTFQAYDSGASIAYGGIVLRLAGLTVVGVLAYLWWSLADMTAPATDDPVAVVYVLSTIGDETARLTAAELLYGRPLTAVEKALVAAIESRPLDSAGPGPEALVNAASRAEALDAIAAMSLKVCAGDYDFDASGPYLTCQDGTPVPVIRTPNIGATLQQLEALVFHSTGSGNFKGDLAVLTDASINASVHLLVSRGGAVVQLVPFDRQAWHAGKSTWAARGLEGLNKYTVGISFTNEGQLKRQTDGSFQGWTRAVVPGDEVTTFGTGDAATYWQTYSDDQIRIAEALVKAFRRAYPQIGVLGHSEISLTGKTDPGPAFPMDRVTNGG